MRILIVGHIRFCHDILLADGNQTVLFLNRERISPKDLKNGHQAIISLAENAPAEQWISHAMALHQAQPFDKVVCYYDQAQQLASQIARALDVSCTVEDDVVAKSANKFAMRQALDAAGVPHCRYQLARGAEQLHAAVAKIGTPCILKPVAGEASIGVARLDRPEDIAQALEWVGADNIAVGIMVEEFMEGQEFSVEAISIAGQHHIVAVTMKYKNPVTFVEVGHVVPAPIESDQRNLIEAYVKDVLTALGFTNSPSHTELIVTGEGPRIVETHTRLAGDQIMDLVQHSSGIDMYALFAHQSLGRSIAEALRTPVTTTQSAAVWYAAPDIASDLIFDYVNGREKALAIPGVVAVEILKNHGDHGSSVTHSHDRSGYAIAVAPSGEEALQAARSAIGTLDFNYRWKAAGQP